MRDSPYVDALEAWIREIAEDLRQANKEPAADRAQPRLTIGETMRRARACLADLTGRPRLAESRSVTPAAADRLCEGVGRAMPERLILHCPGCGLRHVDEGEWATRPHRTHLCVGEGVRAGCGHLWTPVATRATVGVRDGEEIAGE